MTAHILVVDDEPDIRGIIKEILEDEGFTVSVAENGEIARKMQHEHRPDLILLDIWMPDIDGISLLKEWHESGLMNSPVIMISGHGTVETAVEATRLGAYDFIEKPLSISKLLITIQRALEMASLQQEYNRLGKNVQFVTEPLGHSVVMTNLREAITRINQHNTSVLISGEPGSGRTLFAHYIHKKSQNNGPFIQVRIAGMSVKNQMLELFGHLENNTSTRFEQANEGILFIKDIADVDNTVQAQLLSRLENQYSLKNGDVEPVRNPVRIIATTTDEINQAAAKGRLLEELYDYLNVVSLRIPPLREHCEDVPALLEFYTNFFVNKENLPYRRFSVAAQNRLRNYSWLGNVRELKNLVQRLLILGNKQTIEIDEIEPILKNRPETQVGNASIYNLSWREAREQFEKSYLEHQLQTLGGNVSKVASQVGLERTHLYRKLRALDIDPKQVKK
ncbi:MAG: sigma-54-dependent Fis family transcriptional regulator [Gammaproteobacteria bacterium]|nr:MAG: sigma-54-dependent Fis family transcriptional regulator [Gammaproteobacteria bacterium]RKZ45470.1 MAG: sigma-54-dependent Fis family transcriptional regulator [Gammaproteobacteria bacterium]RKZ75130.1 MAG: sigma-54-dependent Fis family transcriptional regulator [Gammaproteobacteria bacterium]